MIFSSKHFILQEFVPPEIFHQWGDSSVQFISREIVELADFVREYFNHPMVVNNWHLGGVRKYSGFRTPDCPEGGKLSQHKFKSAFDHFMPGVNMRDIYKVILENEKVFMEAGLTCMEDIDDTDPVGNPGTGWIHMDNRWTGLDFILIVNPK